LTLVAGEAERLRGRRYSFGPTFGGHNPLSGIKVTLGRN